jgi:hypothetical protein
MQTYSYNINEYNVDQLMNWVFTNLGKNLVASYPGEITDGYLLTGGSDVGFTFFVPLNTQEETDLNNYITNYVYNPDYTDLIKFKINNSFDNPSSQDYDIMGFNKKRTFVKGELKEVGYYKHYDYSANTYSDLVVLETREYNRNTIGITTYRYLTSTWYLNDGNTGLTNSYTKYYTEEEGIQEGIDRRGNMLSFAKTSLLNGLKAIYGEPTNQTYAFDLLMSVKTQMDYFTQGYTQPLRDAVSASTKPYLTEGIKLAVIEQLTF